MAGDWIKMTVGLHEKPEVIAISAEVGKNRFDVVGRLHRLWGWFDQHSSNGHAKSVTPVTVDELVACDGFATALINVGWLFVADGGIEIPNFERHNGQSAKKRAESTERKRKSRQNQDNSPNNVPPASRKKCDQSVTREEKRREDNKPPVSPKGEHATPDQIQKIFEQPSPTDHRFSMTLDWQPNEKQLAARLMSMGINVKAQPALLVSDAIAAFRNYFETNRGMNTQSAWEAKLANWIQRDMRKIESMPQARAMGSDITMPRLADFPEDD